MREREEKEGLLLLLKKGENRRKRSAGEDRKTSLHNQYRGFRGSRKNKPSTAQNIPLVRIERKQHRAACLKLSKRVKNGKKTQRGRSKFKEREAYQSGLCGVRKRAQHNLQVLTNKQRVVV